MVHGPVERDRGDGVRKGAQPVAGDDLERREGPLLQRPAGPGEAAYYAQLTPVYAAFGVPMPAIVPRISLTLVEPGVRKVLDRGASACPTCAAASTASGRASHVRRRTRLPPLPTLTATPRPSPTASTS